jgi:hypothetical protein
MSQVGGQERRWEIAVYPHKHKVGSNKYTLMLILRDGGANATATGNNYIAGLKASIGIRLFTYLHLLKSIPRSYPGADISHCQHRGRARRLPFLDPEGGAAGKNLSNFS